MKYYPRWEKKKIKKKKKGFHREILVEKYIIWGKMKYTNFYTQIWSHYSLSPPQSQKDKPCHDHCSAAIRF